MQGNERSTAQNVRDWIAERDIGTVFTTHELARLLGSTSGKVAAELTWVKRAGAIDHIGISSWKTNALSKDAPKRVPNPPHAPVPHKRPEPPGIRKRKPVEYAALGLLGALDAPPCEQCGHRHATPTKPLSQRLLDLAVEVERLEKLDPKYVTELDLRRELKRRSGEAEEAAQPTALENKK
jgi:hypothetical protein